MYQERDSVGTPELASSPISHLSIGTYLVRSFSVRRGVGIAYTPASPDRHVALGEEIDMRVGKAIAAAGLVWASAFGLVVQADNDGRGRAVEPARGSLTSVMTMPFYARFLCNLSDLLGV